MESAIVKPFQTFDRPGQRAVQVFATLPVVAAYFFYLSIYVVNIPRLDDYANLLLTVLDMRQASGLEETVGMLFRHHNEHITALNRLIACVYYTLFDTLNFRHLAFLGNTFLLLTLWLIQREIPRDPYKVLPLLFAALMLFQPQSWSSVSWAMAAIANHAVWPAGFLGLWLAHRANVTVLALAPAFLMALVTCFIQGNGLIAYLLCGVVVALKPGHAARVTGGAWLAFGALLYWSFLAAPLDPMQQARSEYARLFMFEHPWRVFVYFVSVMGGVWSKNLLMASVAGTAALAYLVYAVFGYLRRQHSLLALYAFYVAGSILAASLFRSFFGAETGVVNVRYYMYSQLLWALIGVDVLLRFARWGGERVFVLASAVALTAALLTSVLTYHESARHSEGLKADLLTGMERWLTGGTRLSSYLPAELDSVARRILSAAVAEGVYDPAKAFPEYSVPEVVTRPKFCSRRGKTAELGGHFRLTTSPGARAIRLTGWLVTARHGRPQQLILCGEKESYRVRNLPWSADYFNLDTTGMTGEPYGFRLILPTRVVREPIHAVGILTPHAGLEVVELGRRG